MLLSKSVILLQAEMTNYCLKTIDFYYNIIKNDSAEMQSQCKFEIIKPISQKY